VKGFVVGDEFGRVEAENLLYCILARVGGDAWIYSADCLAEAIEQNNIFEGLPLRCFGIRGDVGAGNILEALFFEEVDGENFKYGFGDFIGLIRISQRDYLG
jgi:hypothetical protein